MPPQDAVALINIIPRHGYCEMRGGYASHSTGVGSGDVDLVTEFYDGSTRVLLSASSSNIYNSTASGAATSLASGFTSGRWDTAMMNGSMGLVNGANAPQVFNGSTVSAMTVSGSGLTVSNLVGINVFKSRSYFWEINSQSFWYSATNALGGTLTEFDLGQIAKEGGRLLRMTSWTVDGGDGPDDYAVFIMSSGEVLVYQGDNPGSALSWGLVGIYKVSEPVSDRAYANIGGEVALVVEEDVVFMPSSFRQASPPATKLSGAISQAVASLAGNWEMFVYPKESLLLINVPTGLSPDAFDQYVLNLQTGAACRFVDIPSRTWTMYDGQPYFGSTDGVVYRFDSATDDNGSDIDVTAFGAWTDFGAPETKQITALRPTFKADGALEAGIAMGYDFVEPTTSSPSTTVTGGTPWGSPWGSSWGSATSALYGDWAVATGRGSAAAVKLQFSRQGDRPKLYKYDALIRRGGNL